MKAFSIKKDGFVYVGNNLNGDFSEMEIFPELASRFSEKHAKTIAFQTDGEVFLNDHDFCVGQPGTPTYENMSQFTSLSY